MSHDLSLLCLLWYNGCISPVYVQLLGSVAYYVSKKVDLQENRLILYWEERWKMASHKLSKNLVQGYIRLVGKKFKGFGFCWRNVPKKWDKMWFSDTKRNKILRWHCDKLIQTRGPGFCVALQRSPWEIPFHRKNASVNFGPNWVLLKALCREV